ncbi:MAG: hypothetical protein JW749_08225 [Sedimentisphaerales bacterium]|nr:hypothetical protein [Sedimentisphaerales bacterium]
MRLLPGRAGKFESAVGTLYLFHLVLIVAVLLVIQSLFDLARFGAESGQQTGGFLPVGEAETYDTDNLYEKIDGKAPMYQDAGFESLATQRFAHTVNAELGFEHYTFDMGNSRNAFSVYSRQKRADVIDLNELQFGYQTTNGVYFSYGKYYVEMVGFAESQEIIDAMKILAKKLLAELPYDEKDEIEDITLFPPGTIAGSWQLQLKDAFAFDGLSDTYSAKFNADGKTVTIFFSKRNNSDDARAVAKNYTDFLVANGAKVIDPNVLDFYGGTEIVFAAGYFIAGVHEADDRDSAIKAAAVLFEHLNKISEKTGG